MHFAFDIFSLRWCEIQQRIHWNIHELWLPTWWILNPNRMREFWAFDFSNISSGNYLGLLQNNRYFIRDIWIECNEVIRPGPDLPRSVNITISLAMVMPDLARVVRKSAIVLKMVSEWSIYSITRRLKPKLPLPPSPRSFLFLFSIPVVWLFDAILTSNCTLFLFSPQIHLK